ncbi:zinc finger BED domain-containing protein 5-like [Acyrthosiphon pisum]|uniref:Uncharacterized protein n=1 Tax=Acyrthosiphon pisum TaxID=7029 RepID=A0A8R2B9Y3_ACYPI|nr:zinc finger BED domain-containing protein 5-like [Acyrthosiphon pisum]|eukprot:XP_008188989.1 PREDICTED: zinc finger BED domain-containing protein 5-like [Acyrthosiphon pisum]
MPPKRKYNDEYIKFGFTDITVNKEVRPQCVICTTVLSNDALKPAKLDATASFQEFHNCTPEDTLLLTNNEQEDNPIIGRKNQSKTVESRCSKELPNCRAKCNSKIDDELREKLFAAYWSMKNHNRRTEIFLD